MPNFSAPAALHLLHEENIDIPVIIVSGTIGEEKAVECMRLGARDYIMKGNSSRFCPVIARELEEAKIRKKQKETETQKEAAFEEIEKNKETLYDVNVVKACLRIFRKKGYKLIQV
jgi:FixJ family two-component response regulator